jgi:hypothetical protein
VFWKAGRRPASHDVRGDAASGERARPCSGGEDWYGAKSMAPLGTRWRECGESRVSVREASFQALETKLKYSQVRFEAAELLREDPN